MPTIATKDKPAISRDPLSIPEILEFVALYLDTRSLVSALRVSQAWHNTLLPRLWTHLQLYPQYRSKNPSIASIQSHASWVRTLEIGDDRAPSQLWTDVFFPNLSNLDLMHYRAPKFAIHDFIRRHCLTIKSFSSLSQCSDETLEALAACPLLDKLKITKQVLTTTGYDRRLPLYEKLWCRPRELSLLCGCETQDIASDTSSDGEEEEEEEKGEEHPSIPSSNVEILSLQPYARTRAPPFRDVARELQFWFVRQCHNLVKLHWNCRTMTVTQSAMHLLAQEMRSHRERALVSSVEDQWRWKQLESLVLPDHFSKEDFKTLLEGLFRLTELDFRWSNFDLTSWRVLQDFPRHLTTLRTLNIKSSTTRVFGGAIQSMLCSLPSLEWLEAGLIRDLDIIEDGRPWVCLGLKKLTLQFKLESRKTSELMVLSRISALDKLEELILTNNFLITTPSKKSLRLTLKNGLEMLQSLRRLEILTAPPSVKLDWEVEDATWASENWPRLTELNYIRLRPEVRRLLPNLQSSY